MKKTYLFYLSNEDKNVILKKETVNSKKAQQTTHDLYNDVFNFQFTDKEKEDLDFIVGKRISQEMSESELLEFDKINDPEVAGKWLEKHVPNYRTIVTETREAFIRELTENGTNLDRIKNTGSKQANRVSDCANQKQEKEKSITTEKKTTEESIKKEKKTLKTNEVDDKIRLKRVKMFYAEIANIILTVVLGIITVSNWKISADSGQFMMNKFWILSLLLLIISVSLDLFIFYSGLTSDQSLACGFIQVYCVYLFIQSLIGHTDYMPVWGPISRYAIIGLVGLFASYALMYDFKKK